MRSADVEIVRGLARRYAEVCADPRQEERRKLWRDHNSFRFTRPPIYVRAWAHGEMPEARLECEDGFWREIEDKLRVGVYRHRFDDDFISEPWLTVEAEYECAGWGVEYGRQHSDEERGSFKVDYPIKRLEDVKKLRRPEHKIDEQRTREKLARVQEAVGDIVEVNLGRGPSYRVCGADLSTDLGYLRGIEHFMMDMVTEPEWLAGLLGFMSEGVQEAQQQAEDAGDWGLAESDNQAMPYARELPGPAANERGVKRDQLWCFMAAQEFTAVGPGHHEEFLLRYQMPIMERFGLVAYGCCEDLTNKIDMLRQIPNLRRIAVAPAADVRRCAEQIGNDYVLSYRPSPSDMVGHGFEWDFVRGKLREDFSYLKGTTFDITLKDVETVQGDPERVIRWVQMVREVMEENGF